MTRESFSRTVVRNSAYGTGAQIAIKLISFCFSVLVVRSLGAGVYGQYAAIGAFGTLFLFIGDLGLSPYTVRQVARLRDTSDGAEQINALYGNIVLLRVILSLLGVSLMLLFAWLSGRPAIIVWALAINAISMTLYGVQGTSDAFLAGFERIDISSVSRVAYQIAFVLLGAAALFFGLGYYGLICATLAAVVLMTFICWRGVRTLGVLPGRPQFRVWLPLLRASLPFGIVAFTLGLSYKFDSVLLSIFRSDTETGYYNAAYNLVFSAAILSNVINTALYPSLARRTATASQEMPQLYGRMLRYLFMLALPVSVGGWALADQIVPFLYSASYAPATAALRIVIWVVPLMFASEFLGYVVVVSDQERRVARAVVVSTGMNVALNLVLVPRFGVLGAATMTVFTEAVLVAQYVWLLRSTLAHIDWLSTLVRPLLAAFLMGVVALVLRELPLLVNIFTSGLLYVALLLCFGTIGQDELKFVRSLRSPNAQAEGGTP